MLRSTPVHMIDRQALGRTAARTRAAIVIEDGNPVGVMPLANAAARGSSQLGIVAVSLAQDNAVPLTITCVGIPDLIPIGLAVLPLSFEGRPAVGGSVLAAGHIRALTASSLPPVRLAAVSLKRIYRLCLAALRASLHLDSPYLALSLDCPVSAALAKPDGPHGPLAFL